MAVGRRCMAYAWYMHTRDGFEIFRQVVKPRDGRGLVAPFTPHPKLY